MAKALTLVQHFQKRRARSYLFLNTPPTTSSTAFPSPRPPRTAHSSPQPHPPQLPLSTIFLLTLHTPYGYYGEAASTRRVLSPSLLPSTIRENGLRGLSLYIELQNSKNERGKGMHEFPAVEFQPEDSGAVSLDSVLTSAGWCTKALHTHCGY